MGARVGLRKTRIVIGAAMAALFIGSGGARADEPLLTDEQILSAIDLEPGDSENALSPTADVSTTATETIDLNWTAGDSNFQDNAFVLSFTSDDAQSLFRQALLGLGFNKETAALAQAGLHNMIDAAISAPDGVEGTVGVNAASGAFNVQKNAAAIAVIPGSMLALSSAGIGQEAAGNFSLHHDATNDVTATITLNNVSGNVGINLASGVGNVQLNSVTTALSF